MKNPKLIETLVPSATFKLPTYIVTNDGIVDGEGVEIKLCKGSTSDSEVFRQEGTFTESLLQMAVEYLNSVNVPPLNTRETSLAITKIEEALMWLGKRAEDRKIRGVQGTYSK